MVSHGRLVKVHWRLGISVLMRGLLDITVGCLCMQPLNRGHKGQYIFVRLLRIIIHPALLYEKAENDEGLWLSAGKYRYDEDNDWPGQILNQAQAIDLLARTALPTTGR